MDDVKTTIGQALDQAITALEPLDANGRSVALQALMHHLKVDPNELPSSRGTRGPSSEGEQVTRSSLREQRVDIRKLKERVNPTSSIEMACVVAYYVQEHAPSNERKEVVVAKDLEKYFKQAGYKLSKNFDQVLIDAKNKGLLDATAVRGAYKLNAVGYNRIAEAVDGE